MGFLHLTQVSLSGTSTSAFPHLLETNAAPGASDASIIRSEINLAEKDILLIGNELLELHSVEKSLKQRHAELQQYVDAYRPVISAVRRLPPEILLLIFRLCRPSQDSQGWKYPWSLSMVCRKWRSVALSAPHMWSTIFIKPKNASSSRVVSYTRALIQRSAMAPLIVRFTIRNIHFTCLRMLLSVSQRWRKATIVFSGEDTYCRSFCSLRGRLPVLRELVLIGGSTDEDDIFRDYADVFWNAPSLESLSIVNLPLPVFRLPWHQLRRLDIQYSDQDSEDEEDFNLYLQDVLRNLPLLVELKISILATFFDEYTEPITLPCLARLEAACDTRFFHLITLPSLQTLISAPSSVEDNSGVYRASPINSLLSRSRCSLTYLKIHSTDVLAEDAMTIFQEAPALAHLEVDRFFIVTRQLFNALTLRPTQINLLPKLSTVNIWAEEIAGAEAVDAALEFCESRRMSDLQVKLASAFFDWDTRLFDAPSRAYRIQRLIDAGLEINVR
ncbi:hypothetical protein HGRIS_014506 [Hohenbuehelia grisea]|uniref:F-box domain-containing protein n=1 Tax=Hohenbuehelia grisea TaxID=104357 RepID=A0ABR3JVL8_9AGAR